MNIYFMLTFFYYC